MAVRRRWEKLELIQRETLEADKRREEVRPERRNAVGPRAPCGNCAGAVRAL